MGQHVGAPPEHGGPLLFDSEFERRLAMQCAWCLRVAAPNGRYGSQPKPFREDASHGICPRCLRAWLDTQTGARWRPRTRSRPALR